MVLGFRLIEPEDEMVGAGAGALELLFGVSVSGGLNCSLADVADAIKDNKQKEQKEDACLWWPMLEVPLCLGPTGTVNGFAVSRCQLQLHWDKSLELLPVEVGVLSTQSCFCEVLWFWISPVHSGAPACHSQADILDLG